VIPAWKILLLHSTCSWPPVPNASIMPPILSMTDLWAYSTDPRGHVHWVSSFSRCGPQLTIEWGGAPGCLCRSGAPGQVGHASSSERNRCSTPMSINHSMPVFLFAATPRRPSGEGTIQITSAPLPSSASLTRSASMASPSTVTTRWQSCSRASAQRWTHVSRNGMRWNCPVVEIATPVPLGLSVLMGDTVTQY
jgi:hypothetical protein